MNTRLRLGVRPIGYVAVNAILVLLAAHASGQTQRQDMAKLAAPASTHPIPSAPKKSYTAASVLAMPGLKCTVYPTGTAPSSGLTVFTDDDGYARFHAVRATSSEAAQQLTLDCTDSATGKFSVYTADLTSDATFAPHPINLANEQGIDRPALKGDPLSFTQAELLKAGYGLRPDPKDTKAYGHWLAAASKPGRMLAAKRPSPFSHTVTTTTAGAWAGSALVGSPNYVINVATFNVPTAIPGADQTTSTAVSIWNGIGGLNGSGLIQAGVDIATTPTVAVYGSWREYCCGDPDSNVRNGVPFGGAFTPAPGDEILSQEWYCDALGSPNLNGGWGCSFLQDITTGAVLNCTSSTGSPCWSVQALPLCSVSPSNPNCMTLGLTSEFIIENQSPQIKGANSTAFTPLADQVEMDGYSVNDTGNGATLTIGTDPAVLLLIDTTNTTTHMNVSLGNDNQTYFSVSQFAQVNGTALSGLVTCPGKTTNCYPQSIAVGPNAYGSTVGDPWVLSSEQDESGNSYLYRWENNGWVEKPGPGSLVTTLTHTVPAAGKQLAVSPTGYPWIINQAGAVYYWNGSSFLAAPSVCATSIGVGPNAYGSQYGNPWIIGCDAADNVNGSIYQLQGTNWVKQPGTAVRIAVSPQGTPWVITAAGSIWQGDTFNILSAKAFEWLQMPGCATSIGVGPNNDAWITGCGGPGGAGYNIYQLQNGAWVQIPGIASQIAVSPDFGVPWIVNFAGQIFK